MMVTLLRRSPYLDDHLTQALTSLRRSSYLDSHFPQMVTSFRQSHPLDGHLPPAATSIKLLPPLNGHHSQIIVIFRRQLSPLGGHLPQSVTFLTGSSLFPEFLFLQKKQVNNFLIILLLQTLTFITFSSFGIFRTIHTQLFFFPSLPVRGYWLPQNICFVLSFSNRLLLHLRRRICLLQHVLV